MTDDEIRIAIAEACGWKEIRRSSTRESSQPASGLEGTSPRGEEWMWVPDYLSDLNEMADAEKVLLTKPKTDQLDWAYYNTLAAVVAVNRAEELTLANGLGEFCSATARQRAEAFLKTLGLWREPERAKGVKA